FADLVHQMHGQTDRLALIGQSALDRLLDPPRRIRAELSAFGGVKTLDGLHQADVAFGNQVQKRQTEIRVVVRDLHHQTQIGPDHQGSRLAVTLFDFRSQVDLLVGSQKRDLPDLPQVNLDSGIAVFSSHITLFHQIPGGYGSTTSRKFYSSMLCRSRVVASGKVFNKVKYSNLRQPVDVWCSIFFAGPLSQPAAEE